MKATWFLMSCISVHVANAGMEDSAALDGVFGLTEHDQHTLHLPKRMKCDGCVLNALQMLVCSVHRFHFVCYTFRLGLGLA